MPQLGTWRVRRAFMFGVTAFCMGSIVFVLYKGSDTRVAETVVEMGYGTMGAITFAYVFGRVLQDFGTTREHGRSRRARRGYDPLRDGTQRVDDPDGPQED